MRKRSHVDSSPATPRTRRRSLSRALRLGVVGPRGWRVGLAILGLAGSSHATEPSALEGVQPTGSPLVLPIRSKAAIDRVLDLHRKPRAADLRAADRRLLHLEQSTRRVQILLVDAMSKTDRTKQQESMALLRAEWAHWQQLRARVGAEAAERTRLSLARDAARLSEQLAFLETTMRREIDAAERVVAQPAAADRKTEGMRQLRRLRKQRQPSVSSRPNPMLSVAVDREEDPVVLAEGESSDPQSNGSAATSTEARRVIVPGFRRDKGSSEILVPYDQSPPGESRSPSSQTRRSSLADE